jgi:hypothetical protein
MTMSLTFASADSTKESSQTIFRANHLVMPFSVSNPVTSLPFMTGNWEKSDSKTMRMTSANESSGDTYATIFMYRVTLGGFSILSRIPSKRSTTCFVGVAI